MPYSPRTDQSNETTRLAGRRMAGNATRVQAALRDSLDSFKNPITGMNILGRDKKRGSRFSVDAEEYADRYEIEAMYLESGLTATIVDSVAHDYYRKGYYFKTGDDDAELASSVEDEWQRLAVFDRFLEATVNDRLYGGGGAFIGIDDGNLDNPEEPVDEDNIKSVNFINILDKYELRVIEWNNDPNSENFGQPEMYEILAHRTRGTNLFSSTRRNARAFAGRRLLKVHASRILQFISYKLPYHMDSTYALETSPGWGTSIVQRTRRAILNLESVFDGLATIVQEYVQAGFSIQGYADLVGTESGRELVKQRMQLLQYVRSMVNAWVHDDSEELTLQTVETRGLSELIEKSALHVTSITKIPLVKFLGISPSGMNATGVSDEHMYFEYLATGQKMVIIPNLRILTRYILLAKNGPAKGNLPEKWDIHANPLHDVSDKEKAEVQETYARIDAIYLDRAVYTPETCAKSRFGPSEFGTEIMWEDTPEEDSPEFTDEDIAAAMRDAANKGTLPALPGAKPSPATQPAMRQGDEPTLNNEANAGIDVEGVSDAQKVALNGAQSQALQDIVDKVLAGEWNATMGILQAQITIPTVDTDIVTKLMQEAESRVEDLRARKIEEEIARFERQQKLSNNNDPSGESGSGNQPPDTDK